MSKRLIYIDYDTPVLEAMRLMLQHGIAHILIKREGGRAKVFSERDLLDMLPEKLGQLGTIHSGPAASSRPVPIQLKTKIREAAKVMLSKKAKLLLVSAKEPLGVLTATDLAYSLPFTEGGQPKLKSAMTGHVEEVEYGVPIEAVIHRMREKRIGSVMVNRHHKRFGIFTERDLLSILVPPAADLSVSVGIYCRRPVITALVTDTMKEAARVMKSNKIKRLPLTEGGRLAGIVTARDIVEAYAKL
jgi:CBS domain-containing protein